MRAILLAAAAACLTGSDALAGPELIEFPGNCQDTFIHYHTIKPGRRAQAGVEMFANDVALASARDGAPLDGGAVVVMEVCKARLDADENPVVGSDGFFEPDEMAGIAVMETGSAWGEHYPRGVAQPRMGVRRVQAGRPYPDRAQLPAVLRLPKPLQESDCLISFDALSKAPGN